MGIVVIIFIIVAGVIALMVYSAIHERKRREALQEWASRKGLEYCPDKDYDLANYFNFLNALDQGSNRYAENVIRGRYREHAVLAFEHHHETTSTDSNGHPSTNHWWQGVVVLELPRFCPEVTIAREGLMSKIAQAFGYADIDFESHEFSRKFVVRSKDRRFTYDLIRPRAMEIMLKRIGLFGQIEVDQHAMAHIFQGKFKPARIQSRLDLLVDFRDTIPAYVMEDAK